MNNIVKTFPLRMSEDFHQAVKDQAVREGKSIHQLVIEAVTEKLEKVNK